MLFDSMFLYFFFLPVLITFMKTDHQMKNENIWQTMKIKYTPRVLLSPPAHSWLLLFLKHTVEFRK